MPEALIPLVIAAGSALDIAIPSWAASGIAAAIFGGAPIGRSTSLRASTSPKAIAASTRNTR